MRLISILDAIVYMIVIRRSRSSCPAIT